MDTDALVRLFLDRLARLEDELDQLRYLARRLLGVEDAPRH